MKATDERPDASIPPDMDVWLRELAPAERGELEQAWALASLAEEPPPSEAQVAAATARFRQELERTSSPADRPPATRRRGVRLAGWSVMLVACVLLALWFFVRPHTLVAPAGERLRVTLADGSRAELNGGSTLRYRRGLLGGVRRVALDGEAYFDVTHDGRPFAVTTANAEIEVMGTAFGVSSWGAEEAMTEVMLEEGAVRVRSGGGSVDLTPGRSTRVAGEGPPSEPASFNAAMAFAWRTGGIAFDRATLAEITGALARRFGVAIELTPPLAADSLRITLLLPEATSPAIVLDDLCRFSGCAVESTPAGYILTRTP
ncbi:MAG: FecR domain-containing protein [Rhodothermales bacterium]